MLATSNDADLIICKHIPLIFSECMSMIRSSSFDVASNRTLVHKKLWLVVCCVGRDAQIRSKHQIILNWKLDIPGINIIGSVWTF